MKNNEQQKHNDRPIPDYFSNDMEASKHMGAIGCLRTFDKEIWTHRALRVTGAPFWGGSFDLYLCGLIIFSESKRY